MLPAVIAVAVLACAVLHPGVVCAWGSDTILCADYRDMKFFVPTAGVGLAVLIAALFGLAIDLRFRRSLLELWSGSL